MKVLTVLMLITASFSAHSQTISLERGNTIRTDEISGYVYVSCRQEKKIKEFGSYCYDLALVGGSYGKVVVTDGAIDADWVTLQREGTRHIKGARFNPETQATGKKYNLWIRTLLQRALLKKGLNEINYTFKKNKVEVASGVMNIDVVEGDSRACSTRTLYYGNSCPSISQACSDYFYRQNYCR